MGRDVTLALCLTLASGLATTLGAAFALFVPLRFSEVLPISLAFSAGVMIYVSFVGILNEALESFEAVLSEQEQHKDNYVFLAHLFASLSFFGGIFIGYGLDYVVHKLGYDHGQGDGHGRSSDGRMGQNSNYAEKAESKSTLTATGHGRPNTNEPSAARGSEDSELEAGARSKGGQGTAHVEMKHLGASRQARAAGNGNGVDDDHAVLVPLTPSPGKAVAEEERQRGRQGDKEANEDGQEKLQSQRMGKQHGGADGGPSPDNSTDSDHEPSEAEDDDRQALMRMSMVTAIAIALHNFPEGLATFVATLANPTLGVSIAVAIAIHNIPEGISVAMPVYFATRSKMRGFCWAFLSGIAEPIGGFVGYLIIDQMFGDMVFGWLFGITGGIMAYICFHELLPTACAKDTSNKYVSILVFVGFFVMDLSMLLFDI